MYKTQYVIESYLGTGSLVTSATYYAADANQIQAIRTYGCTGATTCQNVSTVSYRIEWTKNPPYKAPMDGSFTANTYTSEGWAIDSGTLLNPLPSLSPLQLEASYVTPANPIKGQTTQYTFLFQVLSDIPSGSYFVIKLPTTPADMSLTSASPTCSSLFSSASLTCVYDAGTESIRVNGMFPSGNSDG